MTAPMQETKQDLIKERKESPLIKDHHPEKQVLQANKLDYAPGSLIYLNHKNMLSENSAKHNNHECRIGVTSNDNSGGLWSHSHRFNLKLVGETKLVNYRKNLHKNVLCRL